MARCVEVFLEFLRLNLECEQQGDDGHIFVFHRGTWVQIAFDLQELPFSTPEGMNVNSIRAHARRLSGDGSLLLFLLQYFEQEHGPGHSAASATVGRRCPGPPHCLSSFMTWTLHPQAMLHLLGPTCDNSEISSEIRRQALTYLADCTMTSLTEKERLFVRSVAEKELGSEDQLPWSYIFRKLDGKLR
jgi:hypothetical protein